MSTTMRSTKLGFETLEAREVPAILSVTNMGNYVLIQADDNGSSVTIERETSNSKTVIREPQAGKSWTFSSSPVQHNLVVFVGGAGTDWVDATGARVKVALHGKGGNDLLVGGSKNDKLWRSGLDYLIGGSSNDNLYGNSGRTSFTARAERLSTTAATPATSPTAATARLPRPQPVRFGTSATDVNQEQTPTCWALAPLSAAAFQGVNLESRITYLGDGEYRVKLLNDDGGYCYQYVNLEGGRLDFEPEPQGDESWVIIYHRAMMQELNIDWKDINDYRGGQCWEVMSMLTGRSTSEHTAYGWEFTLSFLQDMRNALIQDKLVCAGTRQR